MKEIEISYEQDFNGITDIQSMIVPAKNCLCDRCEGDGKVDNPAFSNGFTQEDFDEDPDFKEDYLSGRYDVVCPECDGAKVVQVPDVSRMTFEQKRFAVKVRRHEREQAKADREMAALYRAENWMHFR